MEMKIGSILKMIATREGVKQIQIADKTGMSRAYVSRAMQADDIGAEKLDIMLRSIGYKLMIVPVEDTKMGLNMDLIPNEHDQRVIEVALGVPMKRKHHKGVNGDESEGCYPSDC